jgi:hypothetical protein
MLQAQLADMDAKLEHARGAERATLTAQRGDVSAALALVREVQASMQDMERFESYALSSDSSGEGGLGAQITALERSVPEAARATTHPSSDRRPSTGTSSGGAPSAGSSSANASGGRLPNSAAASAPAVTAAAGTSTAAAPAFHPESAGVIALATQWFALHGTRRQLTGASKQTGSLLDEVNSQRSAITGAVRNVLRDAFGSSTSEDPALGGAGADTGERPEYFG